jgi:hypothetical protein
LRCRTACLLNIRVFSHSNRWCLNDVVNQQPLVSRVFKV